MGQQFDIESYLPDEKKVKAVLSRELKDLPSLPAVVLKLLKISSSAESSAGELVKLVETDPAITARILKVVNSAAYGFSRKIDSIKHAVVLLGFDKMRTLALEISVFEQMVRPGESSGFDLKFFWQHCLSVACLSRAIAEEKGHPDPERLYIAGLLHDIGKMILEVNGKITYGDFIKYNSYFSGNLLKKEANIIGLSHDQLGADFCHLWGLPVSITLPVRFHHERYHQLNLDQEHFLEIGVVSLADFLTWAHGIGSVNLILHRTLQPETMEITSLGTLNLTALLERMDREILETARFYDISFPSLNQLRENLLLFNIDLCRFNNACTNRQDELESQIQSLSSLKDSLPVPHGSLNREEIVKQTLTALHREFSYDRLYFLEVGEKKRGFKISFFLNFTTREDALTGTAVEITAEMKNFIDSLRNRIPKVISGSTSDENQVLEKFGVSELGIIPVVSNEKVIGLLCVDNISSKRAIHQSSLASVSIVTHEMGKALEHAGLFQKYRVMASIDGLTGLYNRYVIEEIIKEYFLKADSRGHPLTLAMIDIDFFKSFNDHFGHIAGDKILKNMANTMQKFSRPNDYLGRYGGEEFIVILTETGYIDGFRYGERLRKKIEKLGHVLKKRFPGHSLTVSIGIASYESGMKKAEDLIAQADKTLYMAKEMGRNKVVGFYREEKKWSGGKSPVPVEQVTG
ncbi:MAG: HDOD domain-containing protein [Thermodesulfobacteriota bacterium]